MDLPGILQHSWDANNQSFDPDDDSLTAQDAKFSSNREMWVYRIHDTSCHLYRVPRCIDDASIGWWCKYKQNCNISATGVVCLAIIPTKVLDVGDDLAYLNTDRCGP